MQHKNDYDMRTGASLILTIVGMCVFAVSLGKPIDFYVVDEIEAAVLEKAQKRRGKWMATAFLEAPRPLPVQTRRRGTYILAAPVDIRPVATKSRYTYLALPGPYTK